MDNLFTSEQLNHIREVKWNITSHLSEMFSNKVWDYEDFEMKLFKNTYLTGGAIASLLQNEDPKDWDFYCKDSVTMDKFALYLTHPSRTNFIKDVDEAYAEVYDTNGKMMSSYRWYTNGKMITSQAITTKNNDSFITVLYGDPEYIRQTFDYVHCMPYFDLNTHKLYISPKQYKACTHKKLIVNNSANVKQWRADKFKQRGYTDA